MLNGASLSWSDGPSRPASSRPAAGSVRKRCVITWPASTGSSIPETAQRPLSGQRVRNLLRSQVRPVPRGNPSGAALSADRAWQAARALADRIYLTVSDVLPTTVPDLALIGTVPGLSAVAAPPEVIVATVVSDDVQVTELVRFLVLPSVYLPLAAYCTFVPTLTVWFAGVTVIDTSAAAVTVRVVVPVTLPELALIWEVPCAAPVARPLALTVATVVFDETQHRRPHGQG